jgi:O-acetyl-ADP-ribose deacetylase (regulator of RNase III)
VCSGGPKIQEECDKYISERGPLSVGEVFTSTGGNLKCKKVIHAVGPHYKGGKMNEENDLYDTVYNCLEEACRLKLESIAMPAISSGVFGFPITLRQLR